MASALETTTSPSIISDASSTQFATDLQSSHAPSYEALMRGRIIHFSENASVQRVFEAKVKQVAHDRLRSFDAPGIEHQVNEDFQEAVRQFRILEDHAFNIKAPPSLTRDSLVTVQGVKLGLNQSILRHCVRTPQEIMTIAQAFNFTQTIRGIIPLTTERLVQHNLIRRFVLNFCLQGELSEELKKVIKPLSYRVMKDPRFENVAQLRNDLEAQALNYLETRDPSGMEERFVHIVQTLEHQARNHDSDLSESKLNEAIAMRAADVTMEVYIQSIVNNYDLSGAQELVGYKPLPEQTKETRRIFMINGGVASGKSTAKKLQDEEAQRQGVQPETVCPINRDAFKPMLMQFNEVDEEFREFFASFTEDEAFLLRDSILREYQDRLKANTAPHLYIDQVSPTLEMLRMAGDPTGQGLDLTIVYAPVEMSFLMARFREQETGYGAVTSGLLNSHANVSTQLVENIEQARKEGMNNIRLKIVANVARGILAPIARIDYAKGRGIIENGNLLLTFFHKNHINRNAKRFAEIYSSQLPPSDQCVSCKSMASQLMRDVNG